ncbi:MAG: MarC family protein, partial [Mariniblastus sp.]
VPTSTGFFYRPAFQCLFADSTSMFKEILSVSLVLFSVIDILGSLPVVVDIKNRAGSLQVLKTTLAAGLLMLLFLVIGDSILHLLGTDVNSFAIAGAIVILLIGLEMVLGIHLFKQNPDETDTTSIVPLAFPLIAGAGTLTTILSLKSEFSQWSITFGIIINLAIVYVVLKSCGWIERRLGHGGLSVLRKVFGIVLLSIAVRLLRTNLLEQI